MPALSGRPSAWWKQVLQTLPHPRQTTVLDLAVPQGGHCPKDPHLVTGSKLVFGLPEPSPWQRGGCMGYPVPFAGVGDICTGKTQTVRYSPSKRWLVNFVLYVFVLSLFTIQHSWFPDSGERCPSAGPQGPDKEPDSAEERSLRTGFLQPAGPVKGVQQAGESSQCQSTAAYFTQHVAAGISMVRMVPDVCWQGCGLLQTLWMGSLSKKGSWGGETATFPITQRTPNLQAGRVPCGALAGPGLGRLARDCREETAVPAQSPRQASQGWGQGQVNGSSGWSSWHRTATQAAQGAGDGTFPSKWRNVSKLFQRTDGGTEDIRRTPGGPFKVGPATGRHQAPRTASAKVAGAARGPDLVATGKVEDGSSAQLGTTGHTALQLRPGLEHLRYRVVRLVRKAVARARSIACQNGDVQGELAGTAGGFHQPAQGADAGSPATQRHRRGCQHGRLGCRGAHCGRRIRQGRSAQCPRQGQDKAAARGIGSSQGSRTARHRQGANTSTEEGHHRRSFLVARAQEGRRCAAFQCRVGCLAAIAWTAGYCDAASTCSSSWPGNAAFWCSPQLSRKGPCGLTAPSRCWQHSVCDEADFVSPPLAELQGFTLKWDLLFSALGFEQNLWRDPRIQDIQAMHSCQDLPLQRLGPFDPPSCVADVLPHSHMDNRLDGVQRSAIHVRADESSPTLCTAGSVVCKERKPVQSVQSLHSGSVHSASKASPAAVRVFPKQVRFDFAVSFWFPQEAQLTLPKPSAGNACGPGLSDGEVLCCQKERADRAHVLEDVPHTSAVAAQACGGRPVLSVHTPEESSSSCDGPPFPGNHESRSLLAALNPTATAPARICHLAIDQDAILPSIGSAGSATILREGTILSLGSWFLTKTLPLRHSGATGPRQACCSCRRMPLLSFPWHLVAVFQRTSSRCLIS